MTEDGRGQPTVVDLGACRCPGAPHQRDTVTLFDDPPMDLGIAMMSLVGQEERIEVAQARLVRVYMRFGIKAWTFTDEDDLPVPVNEENAARLLTFDRCGLDFWNAADEVYSRVYAPLRARMSTTSRGSPTATSTSASPSSSPSRRARSSPSSPESSADGTGSEVQVP